MSSALKLLWFRSPGLGFIRVRVQSLGFRIYRVLRISIEDLRGSSYDSRCPLESRV